MHPKQIPLNALDDTACVSKLFQTDSMFPFLFFLKEEKKDYLAKGRIFIILSFL
jgi:hypothetical protein